VQTKLPHHLAVHHLVDQETSNFLLVAVPVELRQKKLAHDLVRKFAVAELELARGVPGQVLNVQVHAKQPSEGGESGDCVEVDVKLNACDFIPQLEADEVCTAPSMAPDSHANNLLPY